MTFAVERRDDGALVGAVSLRVEREHARAELGYWIGVPYWNSGYGTEAARATVAYGFRELGVDRIFAYHFSVNPASGRVLPKIGMQHEGRLRGHHRKWGQALDSEVYGILRAEMPST